MGLIFWCTILFLFVLFCFLFFLDHWYSITFFLIFLVFHNTFAGFVSNFNPELALGINRFDNFFIIFLSFFYVVSKFENGKIIFLPVEKITYLFLIIYITLGVLSGIKTGTGYQAILLGAFLPIRPFLFFLFIFNLPWKTNRVIRSFRYVYYSIIGVAVLCLFDYAYSLLNNSITRFRFGIPTLQSIFPSPNQFVWYVAIGIIFLTSKYLFHKASFTDCISFCLLSLAGILTMRFKFIQFFTIWFLVTFLIYIAKNNYVFTKKKVLTNLSLFFVFAATCLFIVFPFLLKQINLYGANSRIIFFTLLNQGDISSLFGIIDKFPGRALLLSGSIYLAILHFPLGSGFGTFGSFASQYFDSSIYAELGFSRVPSIPLHATDFYWSSVLAEVGLMGFMVKLGWYFYLISNLYRDLIKLNKDAFFVYIGFTSVLILFSFGWTGGYLAGYNAYYMMYFAAVALKSKKICKRRDVYKT